MFEVFPRSSCRARWKLRTYSSEKRFASGVLFDENALFQSFSTIDFSVSAELFRKLISCWMFSVFLSASSSARIFIPCWANCGSGTRRSKINRAGRRRKFNSYDISQDTITEIFLLYDGVYGERLLHHIKKAARRQLLEVWTKSILLIEIIKHFDNFIFRIN